MLSFQQDTPNRAVITQSLVFTRHIARGTAAPDALEKACRSHPVEIHDRLPRTNANKMLISNLSDSVFITQPRHYHVAQEKEIP